MVVGWSKPYLHHRLGGGPWSAAPGVSLTRVSADTPEGKTLFGLLPQRLRGYAAMGGLLSVYKHPRHQSGFRVYTYIHLESESLAVYTYIHNNIRV